MKVILMADLASLGVTGQVVTVKEGFGRNYLIPRGLAVEADPRNLKAVEHLKKTAELKVKRKDGESQTLKEALEAVTLTFERQAGEEGKLFGSVTSLDIEEELSRAGVQVERKRIHLKEPIKSLGEHLVPVRVSPDLTVELRVFVVAVGKDSS